MWESEGDGSGVLAPSLHPGDSQHSLAHLSPIVWSFVRVCHLWGCLAGGSQRMFFYSCRDSGDQKQNQEQVRLGGRMAIKKYP